jgi:hypothetical protein
LNYELALIHELWRRGELSYKLHATQLTINDAVNSTDADEVLVLSSRQLGKSYWATVYAIQFCLQHPKTIARILAPTLKQVQDVVADNLNPISIDAPEGLITRAKTSYRWHFSNGSELRLGSLERANVDNNRGGNASLIITEEGGFVESDDFAYAVESVIGPQLLRSGGRLIHVTSPSADTAHYLHTNVKPKTQLSNSFFSYTVYDNPQLTQEQIEKAMKRCGGEHSISWKREYLAQIIRDEETTVVSNFSNAIIEDPAIPSHAFYTIAVDLGFSKDLSAGALTYFDYVENKTVVHDSIVWERGTSTSKIVEDLKKMEDKHNIHNKVTRFFDADPRLRDDLAQLHNYPVNVLEKTNLDAQLNLLNVAIGNKEIVIRPHNKHLLATLENGAWNSNRTDFKRTKDLGHLDSLMALLYAHRMQIKGNPYPPMHNINPATQHIPYHLDPRRKNDVLKGLIPTF